MYELTLVCLPELRRCSSRLDDMKRLTNWVSAAVPAPHA